MSRNERYFELWDSSKQDLCNHSLELEKELAKLKEENEKLKKLISRAITLKLLHQPLTMYGLDWTYEAKEALGE